MNSSILSSHHISSFIANSKYIVLVVGNDGTISEIQGVAMGHYVGISRRLAQAGNLNCFFDLPENMASLDRLMIPSRPAPLSFEEGLDFFYTLLPIITIRLNRVSKEALLGIVSVSELLPTLFEESDQSLLLYIDKADRVVGYTQAFNHLFGQELARPTDLLGLNAGRFMDPVPSEIQKVRISRAAAGLDKGWSVCESHPAPMEWRAEGPGLSILSFSEPMDFSKEEMKVEISLAPGNRFWPGLFLGEPGSDRVFYDAEGYALSRNPDNNTCQIKKRGFLAEEAPGPVDSGGTWEFIRTGNVLMVRKDGRSLAAYADLRPLERDRFHLTLFLRQGEACRPTSLKLWKRPAQARPREEEVVVRLKDAAGSEYLMDRFYSFSLTGFHRNLSGFRMRNISHFQARIEGLERRVRRTRMESRKLKSLLVPGSGEQVPLIGVSRAMQAVREKADRAASSGAGVLIQGETGTGKEVLARYLHDRGERRDMPFVKVDCSVLPASLLESELFGHEKGAFTGADAARAGLFENAQGGTLFIDEINNLPLPAQAKLLAFLQDHAITRIGGKSPLALDVRVVVASGKDLPTLVQKGLFREDLYYRIAVVTFDMPALRHRKEDLPGLCEHFLALYSAINSREIERISAEAYRRMYAHHWPGNVRELRNVIERAVLFCDGVEITGELIRIQEGGPAPARGAGGRKVYQPITLLKGELEELLRRHQGMVGRAAGEINSTPRALYYMLEREGIDPDLFRKRPRKRKNGKSAQLK